MANLNLPFPVRKGDDYMGRGKRKKQKKQETNLHHVLFQRKHWTNPKAVYLRRIFVYPVPVKEHNELHKEILHDVPIPRDLDILYERAVQDSFKLKFTGFREGLIWLYETSCDPLFRECILRQYEFFFQERPP